LAGQLDTSTKYSLGNPEEALSFLPFAPEVNFRFGFCSHCCKVKGEGRFSTTTKKVRNLRKSLEARVGIGQISPLLHLKYA
jgi:hypothetical protein